MIKSIRLEQYKIKHRYFYLTWFLLTLAPLLFELYNLRSISFSDRYTFNSPLLYYYYTESATVELLGLFLPLCASILISKLCDSEHQENTWKLLLTSNQSFTSLWYSKFFIVFFLMELTTALIYLFTSVRIFLGTSYPVPILTLSMTFLGISAANLIVLTIAEFLAVYFRNQVIVLIEGIIGSFIGIISSLLPRNIVYFLPWGYYSLNILAGNRPNGYNAQGLLTWEIYTIEPPYLLIFGVGVIFIMINILMCRYLSRKEI